MCSERALICLNRMNCSKHPRPAALQQVNNCREILFCFILWNYSFAASLSTSTSFWEDRIFLLRVLHNTYACWRVKGLFMNGIMFAEVANQYNDRLHLYVLFNFRSEWRVSISICIMSIAAQTYSIASPWWIAFIAWQVQCSHFPPAISGSTSLCAFLPLPQCHGQDEEQGVHRKLGSQ